MCLYYGGSGKTVVSDLVYFKSFGKKKMIIKVRVR